MRVLEVSKNGKSFRFLSEGEIAPTMAEIDAAKNGDPSAIERFFNAIGGTVGSWVDGIKEAFMTTKQETANVGRGGDGVASVESPSWFAQMLDSVGKWINSAIAWLTGQGTDGMGRGGEGGTPGGIGVQQGLAIGVIASLIVLAVYGVIKMFRKKKENATPANLAKVVALNESVYRRLMEGSFSTAIIGQAAEPAKEVAAYLNDETAAEGDGFWAKLSKSMSWKKLLAYAVAGVGLGLVAYHMSQNGANPNDSIVDRAAIDDLNATNAKLGDQFAKGDYDGAVTTIGDYSGRIDARGDAKMAASYGAVGKPNVPGAGGIR